MRWGPTVVGLLTAIAVTNLQTAAQFSDELPIKGQLSFSTHTYKLQSGKEYEVIVIGQGVKPMVSVDLGPGLTTPTIVDPSGMEVRMYLAPKESKEYQFYVGGVPVANVGGVPTYSFQVKQLSVVEGIVLKQQGVWDGTGARHPNSGCEYRGHQVYLKERVTYAFEMVCLDSPNVRPYLMLEDPNRMIILQDTSIFNQPNPKNFKGRLTYTPNKSGIYTVIATTTQFNHRGKYEVVVRAERLTPPIFERKENWNPNDPIYTNGNPHKAYKLKLQADKTYQIDLVRPPNFGLDPYLYLEDENMQVVAEDDDSGGNLNARIIFRPKRTAEYRIIATTLNGGFGPFELRVYDTVLSGTPNFELDN